MITDRALLNLMNWLSPSFPVGGYAYSHGIEFAVEDGRIKNEQQLVSWVEAALVKGSGRTDGLLFVEAWNATTENDLDRLRYTIELGDVWRSTSEMAL
ncbi:MAG: urease accessory UreF family protein, partial [Pseudomonadota bacterium]|nr:urease accessory UreF family protein [Pseudomonadota bacterium]